MAMELRVNIEQVRDDCRNRFLDGRYREGLPCHEVDGFGDLQTPHLHDSYQQTLTIDGTFEILATTFTNADPSASIVRVVTITFEP